MKIKQCHPAWPQHSNFSCPTCGSLYQDGDEYDEFSSGPDDDESMAKCLQCGNDFIVRRIVTITYHTEKLGKKIPIVKIPQVYKDA
jgi:predicted RNA-binding Zn-ribbon protein involved in translation (DUF1610 family)